MTYSKLTAVTGAKNYEILQGTATFGAGGGTTTLIAPTIDSTWLAARIFMSGWLVLAPIGGFATGLLEQFGSVDFSEGFTVSSSNHYFDFEGAFEGYLGSSVWNYFLGPSTVNTIFPVTTTPTTVPLGSYFQLASYTGQTSTSFTLQATYPGATGGGAILSAIMVLYKD